MAKLFVIIEGEHTSGDPNLRVGMGELLRKALTKGSIKIKPLGGRSEAIKRFKKQRGPDIMLLLIDLDGPPSRRKSELQKEGLSTYSSDVFFMIQEMEAWFISQSDILIDHWGEDLFQNFRNRNPRQIAKPSKELEKCTKGSKHGTYGKISDGARLLKKLDPQKLKADFTDFKKLIKRIEALS